MNFRIPEDQLLRRIESLQSEFRRMDFEIVFITKIATFQLTLEQVMDSLEDLNRRISKLENS